MKKKQGENTHINTHIDENEAQSDDGKTSSQWANTSLVTNVQSTDNNQGGLSPTTRRWNLRWTRRIGYQDTRSTLHFTVRWKSVSSEHAISYLHNHNSHTNSKKTHINASPIHFINASYIHPFINASSIHFVNASYIHPFINASSIHFINASYIHSKNRGAPSLGLHSWVWHKHIPHEL